MSLDDFPFSDMFSEVGFPTEAKPVEDKTNFPTEAKPVEDKTNFQTEAKPVEKDYLPDEPVEDKPEEFEIPENEEVVEKKRKKPNRMISYNDTQFVVANFKNMSYTDMAEKLGLTKQQINRILYSIKDNLRKKAKGSDQESKVEAFINKYLTKPDSHGGEVQNAISQKANEILESILK